MRGAGGKSNAKEMAIAAAEVERSRKRLATLLADATGRPLAEIEEMIEHDHYCNAQEALELGLIDSIGAQGLFLPREKDANKAEEQAPAPEKTSGS